MATLTTQVITRAGTVIGSAATAVGGDAMQCGTSAMLIVLNGSGSSITVTLAVPSSRTYESDVAISSPVITIAAGATKWIGPIDGQTFMDPTTGLATITYSAVTSVTVGSVQLSQ